MTFFTGFSENVWKISTILSAADSHLRRGFERRDLRPAEKVLLAYLFFNVSCNIYTYPIYQQVAYHFRNGRHQTTLKVSLYQIKSQ